MAAIKFSRAPASINSTWIAGTGMIGLVGKAILGPGEIFFDILATAMDVIIGRKQFIIGTAWVHVAGVLWLDCSTFQFARAWKCLWIMLS